MNIYISFVSGLYFRGQKAIRQSFLLSVFFLAACSTVNMIEDKPLLGIVSAPTNDIQSAGIQMLGKKGNAVDAMSAMLMTSAVVFPSRSGLGAGGVCQVLDTAEGRVKSLNFLNMPINEKTNIGIPALSRGVFTLQNKYGRKPWADVLRFAVQKAKNGFVVSDEFARDILEAKGLKPKWRVLKKGDSIKQPQLAQTLTTISQKGAGSLYSGEMADAILAQRANLNNGDLKPFRAQFMDSIDVSTPLGKTYLINPSILSSEGYMIWKNLNTNKPVAQQKADEAMKVLDDKIIDLDKTMKGIGLMAADKDGLVVVCAVSMGESFGTGFETKEGFFLSQAMDKDAHASSYWSAIQTNDQTNSVYQASSFVGDYALVDGLDFLKDVQRNEKTPVEALEINQENLTEARFDILAQSFFLACSEGTLKNLNSCKDSRHITPVYEQE